MQHLNANSLRRSPNLAHLGVAITSDIDGTVQDESLPEAERIHAISDAREAFAAAELQGHPVSLMSSRTLSEINLYREALYIHGFVIGEDGGALQLPEIKNISAIRAAGFNLTTFQGKDVVLISRTTTADIQALLLEVEAITQSHIISSATSTPEELQKAAGHATLELAEASMARAVSAYSVGLNTEQLLLCKSFAASSGIRILGSPNGRIHHFSGTTADGHPADKGQALEALCKIIKIIEGAPAVVPVVIGNAANDLPLFEMALKMKGQAIAVPREGDVFAFGGRTPPLGTIMATLPAGQGVKEMLPQALELAEKTAMELELSLPPRP